MKPLECCVCHAPLTGGTDTYSDVSTPMCMWCWFELSHMKKEELQHFIECANCNGRTRELGDDEKEEEIYFE